MKLDYEYQIISYQDYLNFRKEKVNQKYAWVKSIMIFIFPYPQETHFSDKYLPAKFSYGKDYHQVIQGKLKKIAEELKLGKYEVLADISFLDEKACGVLSGLGEIGKNNLLLTEKYGSRVFIGEIVTDKEFPSFFPKGLFANKNDVCLNCNLCLDNCPTDALRDGFHKNQCLSFLSQKKSSDYPLYEKMQVYYGCDICQDVCPVNNKKYNYLEEFAFSDDLNLCLEDLEGLTDDEYRKRFRNKAFNWIGLLKMLRNIIVLEVNNGKITEEKIIELQKKYSKEKWFVDHLEYMKGKITNGIN